MVALSERFQKLCRMSVDTEVIEELPYKIPDLTGETLEVQALQNGVFKVTGKLELVELFYKIQQTFLWPDWHKDRKGKVTCGNELTHIRHHEVGGVTEACFSVSFTQKPVHMEKAFGLMSHHGLKFKERV